MQPDVQFEEDSIGSMYERGNSSGFDSPVASFLVKIKFIKNERQAAIFVVVLAVVILAVAFFFIKSALAEPQIIELKTF